MQSIRIWEISIELEKYSEVEQELFLINERKVRFFTFTQQSFTHQNSLKIILIPNHSKGEKYFIHIDTKTMKEKIIILSIDEGIVGRVILDGINKFFKIFIGISITSEHKLVADESMRRIEEKLSRILNYFLRMWIWLSDPFCPEASIWLRTLLKNSLEILYFPCW